MGLFKNRTSVFAALIFSAALLFSFARADESWPEPRLEATQLVSEVVRNELNAQEQDKSLWEYQEVHQENGRTELREIVETLDGPIYRVIAINGKPLSEREHQNEEGRIETFLSNPNEFREKQKNLARDAEEVRKVLQMLPQALVYTYDGTEDGLIRLNFRPDPKFRASGHESEVFHHMEGKMLIDPQSHRLAEIEGRLVTEVKFWGGVLAHLDKGGTFRVKRQDVGRGHWEMVDLNVEMNGKALFKTLALHEKQTNTDFHLLPEQTTLKQAGELLAINTLN